MFEIIGMKLYCHKIVNKLFEIYRAAIIKEQGEVSFSALPILLIFFFSSIGS